MEVAADQPIAPPPAESPTVGEAIPEPAAAPVPLQQADSSDDTTIAHHGSYRGTMTIVGHNLHTARRALLAPWAISAEEGTAQVRDMGAAIRTELASSLIIEAGLTAMLREYIARHGPSEPVPARALPNTRGGHRGNNANTNQNQQSQPHLHGIVECVVERPIAVVVDVTATPAPPPQQQQHGGDSSPTAGEGRDMAPAQVAYRWARRYGLPVMMPAKTTSQRNDDEDGKQGAPGEITHFRMAIYRAGAPERELALGAALRVLTLLTATSESANKPPTTECPVRANNIRFQGRFYQTIGHLARGEAQQPRQRGNIIGADASTSSAPQQATDVESAPAANPEDDRAAGPGSDNENNGEESSNEDVEEEGVAPAAEPDAAKGPQQSTAALTLQLLEDGGLRRSAFFTAAHSAIMSQPVLKMTLLSTGFDPLTPPSVESPSDAIYAQEWATTVELVRANVIRSEYAAAVSGNPLFCSSDSTPLSTVAQRFAPLSTLAVAEGIVGRDALQAAIERSGSSQQSQNHHGRGRGNNNNNNNNGGFNIRASITQTIKEPNSSTAWSNLILTVAATGLRAAVPKLVQERVPELMSDLLYHRPRAEKEDKHDQIMVSVALAMAEQSKALDAEVTSLLAQHFIVANHSASSNPINRAPPVLSRGKPGSGAAPLQFGPVLPRQVWAILAHLKFIPHSAALQRCAHAVIFGVTRQEADAAATAHRPVNIRPCRPSNDLIVIAGAASALYSFVANGKAKNYLSSLSNPTNIASIIKLLRHCSEPSRHVPFASAARLAADNLASFLGRLLRAAFENGTATATGVSNKHDDENPNAAPAAPVAVAEHTPEVAQKIHHAVRAAIGVNSLTQLIQLLHPRHLNIVSAYVSQFFQECPLVLSAHERMSIVSLFTDAFAVNRTRIPDAAAHWTDLTLHLASTAFENGASEAETATKALALIQALGAGAPLYSQWAAPVASSLRLALGDPAPESNAPPPSGGSANGNPTASAQPWAITKHPHFGTVVARVIVAALSDCAPDAAGPFLICAQLAMKVLDRPARAALITAGLLDVLPRVAREVATYEAELAVEPANRQVHLHHFAAFSLLLLEITCRGLNAHELLGEAKCQAFVTDLTEWALSEHAAARYQSHLLGALTNLASAGTPVAYFEAANLTKPQTQKKIANDNSARFTKLSKLLSGATAVTTTHNVVFPAPSEVAVAQLLPLRSASSIPSPLTNEAAPSRDRRGTLQHNSRNADPRRGIILDTRRRLRRDWAGDIAAFTAAQNAEDERRQAAREERDRQEAAQRAAQEAAAAERRRLQEEQQRLQKQQMLAQQLAQQQQQQAAAMSTFADRATNNTSSNNNNGGGRGGSSNTASSDPLSVLRAVMPSANIRQAGSHAEWKQGTSASASNQASPSQASHTAAPPTSSLAQRNESAADSYATQQTQRPRRAGPLGGEQTSQPQQQQQHSQPQPQQSTGIFSQAPSQAQAPQQTSATTGYGVSQQSLLAPQQQTSQQQQQLQQSTTATTQHQQQQQLASLQQQQQQYYYQGNQQPPSSAQTAPQQQPQPQPQQLQQQQPQQQPASQGHPFPSGAITSTTNQQQQQPTDAASAAAAAQMQMLMSYQYQLALQQQQQQAGLAAQQAASGSSTQQGASAAQPGFNTLPTMANMTPQQQQQLLIQAQQQQHIMAMARQYLQQQQQQQPGAPAQQQPGVTATTAQQQQQQQQQATAAYGALSAGQGGYYVMQQQPSAGQQASTTQNPRGGATQQQAHQFQTAPPTSVYSTGSSYGSNQAVAANQQQQAMYAGYTQQHAMPTSAATGTFGGAQQAAAQQQSTTTSQQQQRGARPNTSHADPNAANRGGAASAQQQQAVPAYYGGAAQLQAGSTFGSVQAQPTPTYGALTAQQQAAYAAAGMVPATQQQQQQQAYNAYYTQQQGAAYGAQQAAQQQPQQAHTQQSAHGQVQQQHGHSARSQQQQQGQHHFGANSPAFSGATGHAAPGYSAGYGGQHAYELSGAQHGQQAATEHTSTFGYYGTSAAQQQQTPTASHFGTDRSRASNSGSSATSNWTGSQYGQSHQASYASSNAAQQQQQQTAYAVPATWAQAQAQQAAQAAAQNAASGANTNSGSSAQ